MGFLKDVLIYYYTDYIEHRKALLNKRMNHIGIGIHEHSTQCFVVVIILANHVKEIEMTNAAEEANCECKVI